MMKEMGSVDYLEERQGTQTICTVYSSPEDGMPRCLEGGNSLYPTHILDVWHLHKSSAEGRGREGVLQ